MFICPSCGVEATRLIIFNEPKKLGCASCGVPSKPFSNVNLHQAEKWTHVDKQGNEKKHKLTQGKSWEIENRTLAEDGKTVVNKKTNQPAQY